MLAHELAAEILRQQANALAEHTGTEIEQIHQARVATRRLRAALRVFSAVLPTETEGTKNELKWIAGQLGAVRDVDVQLHRLSTRAAELDLGHAVAPFQQWLVERRQQALGSLGESQQSERFARLVSSLQAAKASPSETNIEQFASPKLRRAHSKLRKRAKTLHHQSPEAAFHQVRIRAKRLRYTAEFFEPIYGKPARRLIKAAVALQDLLGDLQDGVVQRQHIHAAMEREMPVQTALALGRLVQWETQHAGAIRRDFKDAYADVERAWGKLGKAL